MSILLAILGISVLVIVHEAGHYLAARAFGMRVLRFSVGFGPTIAKFQPQGSSTVFQIGLVPFLAYVQIAGMNPAEENDPNDPELYSNKSVLARFLTIFAGPFANYLIASVLVFSLALMGHHGENPPHEPMMVEHRSARLSGGKGRYSPGDIIVQANQKPVQHVNDLIEITSPRAKKPTAYLVERDGKRAPALHHRAHGRPRSRHHRHHPQGAQRADARRTRARLLGRVSVRAHPASARGLRAHVQAGQHRGRGRPRGHGEDRRHAHRELRRSSPRF